MNPRPMLGQCDACRAGTRTAVYEFMDPVPIPVMPIVHGIDPTEMMRRCSVVEVVKLCYFHSRNFRFRDGRVGADWPQWDRQPPPSDRRPTS